ncbi:MAG: lytic transglycosylase domain-containing protein [Saprospiraceae bacterium]
MKKLLYINIIFILLIIIIFSFTNKDLTNYNKKVFEPLPQVISSPQIKKEYSFAGENVSIESFDIYERLDRELINNSYGHSSTVQNIKLAGRFFPVISPILKEYGVPDDFKYLAIAESGLRNVVSSAGAAGYWQFMKPTANELGLKINSEIDERYDIEKSTRAAAEYLLKLKAKFGTWVNSAAAYNMGMTKLKNTYEDQKEEDFFNMNVNSETMRYFFRILAIKEILEHPGDFGFHISNDDKYKELNDYYEVKVDSTIENLGDFAHNFNISYRMLKIYNPWMISEKLTYSGEPYYIKIKR